MMPGRQNGSCHLNDDEWIEYRERADRMETIITEIHSQNHTLVQHAAHLQKLDALTEIKDKLLESATGRNQFDIGIAQKLFTILGMVIMALVFIIVFLLTGAKLGLLDLVAK
jgi:hypothetical protein